jgi:cytochrome c peroxidase
MRWLVCLCLAGCQTCPIEDGIAADTCGTLQKMQLPDKLAADPTNAKADDYDAAVLGFHLFFDARFSSSHTIRCATCHAPETHFDDQKPVAIGLQTGTRNAPSTLTAAWQSRFLWDGRADVLWAPPIGALENPKEMDFTRLEIAHAIHDYESDRYQNVFGALPALDDGTRFPARGKPGDDAFDQMSPDDQDAVNRVAANVGKALAAYLRQQASRASAFDRYLDGDKQALTASQKLGMLRFVESGCARCHSGPQLSDEQFHSLGVGSGDPGRAAGIELEREQIFSPDGPYSDSPRALAIADPTPADEAAFRTPTLRNVTLSNPYFHDGSAATLDDAIAAHDLSLASGDQAAIVDFLGALVGTPPPPPWNQWQDIP